MGPQIELPKRTSFKTPWLPNQYTKAIAAKIEGLRRGISEIILKKPLNGIHVRVRAQANKKAKMTTIKVDMIAINKLLKKDWNSAGS